VAGEQFHSDGGIDQVDFERRRGDRDSFVAAEHFWTFSLSFADARWGVNNPEVTAGKILAALLVPQSCLPAQTDIEKEKECLERS
jgi:hypothetical protein